MPVDWNAIAEEAGRVTDIKYSNMISSMTRLNDDEIITLIVTTGISQEDMTLVLKEVKDATKKNNAKAESIMKISKGVDVLVGLADKLL
jgi:hypothetical protein